MVEPLLDIEVSVALAIGDHNFSDLPEFVLDGVEEPEPRPLPSRKHLDIMDLLNPEDSESSQDDLGCKPAPKQTFEVLSLDSSLDFIQDVHLENETAKDCSSLVDPNLSKADIDMTSSKKNNAKKFKKRQRTLTDDCFGSDHDLSDREMKKTKTLNLQGAGTSRSAKASFAKRESFRKGTLVVMEKGLEKWKKKDTCRR